MCYEGYHRVVTAAVRPAVHRQAGNNTHEASTSNIDVHVCRLLGLAVYVNVGRDSFVVKIFSLIMCAINM